MTFLNKEYKQDVQEDDGTRMLSTPESLWKLHEAFKQVLGKARIDYSSFTAKEDDPQCLIDFLLE